MATRPASVPPPTRSERDSLGTIEVPAARLWGAQTQRSLHFFRVGGHGEVMPEELVLALVLVKRAAATVNARLADLPEAKADAIARAADEVLRGDHRDEFPLSVWQTGSGTQTNMNVNEVLANRASELLGGPRGEDRQVHPNDDVNRSQSSNDTFPTAMHLAALGALEARVLVALRGLRAALDAKATAYADIVKLGRTHLQDATPVTLGQELSGHVAQLDHAERGLVSALPALRELAVGGTAVGTGLNAPAGFGPAVAAELTRLTGRPLVSAPNKFSALASCDPMATAHAALKGLAMTLFKIANDIRWLASGPRAGLGELTLPENEPGSSIMPGKVNPTQAEMLTMVCARVLGNDVTISLGAASGSFELNVFRPMIAQAFLQSCRLLADAMESFTVHCVEGLQPNLGRIAQNLSSSLMLVTALVPHLGYDAAARVAQKAHTEGTSLKEAALALGVREVDFDAWVRPEDMVRVR